jgi:hypothetical protein
MKRTIALGAAWTASAAAAVGLGFLAVSLVDASASPGAQPVAATTTAATATGPTTAPTSATGQYDTPGGTVYADCSSGAPVLAGVPVAGWSVDDSNDPGEMEFDNGAQKVEVHVLCTDGAPVFGLDYSSERTSAVPYPASPTSGHGADDGPGDDSSGRDGGGHGSDD